MENNCMVKYSLYILFFFVFTYFWLYCIFVAAWVFSSCSWQSLLSSCGVQASHCSGFSYYRTGAPWHMGFSSCSIWAQSLQVSDSRAQVQ